jgi:molecular chaperone HscB
VFGLPRKLRQDCHELEKRFYRISRVLHPDRFSAPDKKAWKHLSLERMSFINQAYQTLKDPMALRNYLLEQEGIRVQESASQRSSSQLAQAPSDLPLDIIETWFDLQEKLLEDPEGTQGLLTEFTKTLSLFKQDQQDQLASLEIAYDASSSREILESIGKCVKISQYIHSIEKDLKRFKANADSD